MDTKYKNLFQKCLNQIELGYANKNSWFYQNDKYWGQDYWTNSITMRLGERWYETIEECYYNESYITSNSNQTIKYPFYSITYDPHDGPYIQLLGRKLKIFVYLPPTLNNLPDSTAYANLQYTYYPKAHDMYKDSTHNQDIFITFIPQDSSFTGKYDSETNLFSWVPSLQDLGPQRLEFIIKDKYNTTNHRFYDINVLISPCETLDTLYINTTDTIYIENPSPNKQTITIKTKSPFSPFP